MYKNLAAGAIWTRVPASFNSFPISLLLRFTESAA